MKYDWEEIMNNKILMTTCFGLTITTTFNVECKYNKNKPDSVNIEKQVKKSKNQKTFKNEAHRESQIQDFFDPNLDQDLKIDNVFENPSKLKIWIRAFGIGLLCKYYIAKYWVKTKIQKMFNVIK